MNTKPTTTTSKRNSAKTASAIEALESRIAPASLGLNFKNGGVGNDIRAAKFLDADGDLVKIKLRAFGDKDAAFDIVLTGGVRNNADIESITIVDKNPGNGPLKGTFVVNVGVFSQTILKGFGRNHTDHDGNWNNLTPGATEIGLFESPSSFKGLQLNGAVADQVNVSGNLASYGIRLTETAFFGVAGRLGLDPLDKVDVGNVNITGNLGAFIFNGRVDISNNIEGRFNVGGDLGRFVARDSDVEGLVQIGGDATQFSANSLIGNLEVGGNLINLDLGGDLFGNVDVAGTDLTTIKVNGGVYSSSATKTGGDLLITVTGLSASQDQEDYESGSSGVFAGVADVGGALTLTAKTFASTAQVRSVSDMSVKAGEIAGSMTSGDTLTLISTGGDFDGVGIGASISDFRLNGGDFRGTLHATAGSVGNLTVTGADADFRGTVLSDAGSVGDIVASEIRSADVRAQLGVGALTGTLGISSSTFQSNTAGVGALTTNGGGIESVDVIANAGIGNITGAQGISNSDFRSATAGIGNLSSSSGSISDVNVNVATGIGNVSSGQSIASSRFESSGGAIGTFSALSGNISNSQVRVAGGIGAIGSAHGISNSVFDTLGGNIGAIVSNADTDDGPAISFTAFTAAGGSIGAISARSADNGFNATITGSTFTAFSGIGNVTATQVSSSGGRAITGSSFNVTGAGNIGNVVGDSRNSNGISDSFFQVNSGNVGSVTGISGSGHGISEVRIITAAGNVGAVSGTSAKFGDGLNNVQVEAGVGLSGTGNLAGVTGTAFSGNGISTSRFTSGTGGIGAISGVSTTTGLSGTFDGIFDSDFFTQGSITSITGTTASGSGIRLADVSADGIAPGGSVGDVLVNGNGIQSITGRTTGVLVSSVGIDDSTFRSGNDIGPVNASTALNGQSIFAIRGSHDLINTTFVTDCLIGVPIIFPGSGSTVFTAFDDIGAVNIAGGDVDGAAFNAGYDYGSELTLNGIAGGQDFAPTVAQQAANADLLANNIGAFTVSHGDIFRTVITAGRVTGNTGWGDTDDGLNGPGSTITSITAADNGFLDTVVISTATLGPVNVGSMNNVNINVNTVGNLTLIGSFPGRAALANTAIVALNDIGNINVQNLSTVGGAAILSSAFVSKQGNIGNVYGLTLGGNSGGLAGQPFSSDGLVNAIDSSCFVAAGSVGNGTSPITVPVLDGSADGSVVGVRGRVFNNNADFASTGILNSTVTADSDDNDTGSIFAVEALTNGSATDADGIRNSTFESGNGIGGTNPLENSSGIRVIVGSTTASGGGGDDGIEFSTFTANVGLTGATGSIGNIKVTSTAVNGDGITISTFTGASIGAITIDPPGDDGIEQSTFTAEAGSIGNINVLVGAAATASTPGTGDDGIANSSFTATTTIGTITVLTVGARGDDGSGFFENFDGHDAIVDSTFTANSDGTAAGVEGIGAISATVQGTFFASDGIDGSNFTGTDIGNITALSSVDDGIDGSSFTATAGSIGTVSGTTTGTSTDSDGIFGSSFFAQVNIGNVTGTSAGDDGIDGSSFTANTGSIGTVSGTTTGTGTDSDGIVNSLFNAQVNIGDVTGTSAGDDGIATSTFNAITGNIGAVSGTTTATSTGSNGIFSSFFTAQVNIGNVTGTSAGDNGIVGSTFRATAGNIGTVRGAATGTGAGSDGIDNSTFIATAGSIGTVTGTSTGTNSDGIFNSGFTAGVDIGNVTGTSAGDDGIELSTFTATTGSIGAVSGTTTATTTTSDGIVSGTFTARVNIGNVTGTSAGDDGIDTSNFTATTGSIGVVSGTTTGTGVGSRGIFNTNFTAGVGIGNVTGTSAGGTGIDRGIFTATAGSIGTVNGTSSATGTVGDGIDASNFVAGTSIGNITVVGDDEGISNDSGVSAFTAGTTIGAINATASSGFPAIDGARFTAGTGITSITATNTSTGEAILGAVFRVINGNIGAIAASTAGVGQDAIDSSIFSAGRTAGAVGNIAAITVSGGGASGANINATRFLAGYDVGADGVVGAGDVISAAASSIASITVNGRFIGSDAITSAAQGATAGWGNDAETSVAGSSIGTVTIGQPADPAANYIADGVATNAIQSAAIGTVTIGGGAASVPPGQYDPNADGDDGDEIRIRVI